MARLSLCEGFETHMPRQSRIERRAFKKFEDNYLHNSMARLRRLHDLRFDFDLRMAERKGFLDSGVQTGSLVTYLESIGAQDVSEESAIPLVLRVVKGYRERNDLLEQARLEADETIETLERDLEKSRDNERKTLKQAVKYKSELTVLKENHTNAISTGARTVSRGVGAASNTDSIRTVRVPGVDQASR